MEESDIYDVIFFEKQEGQLCAQHCLNNLIQSQMFTAVDLADIARQLDESERGLMNPNAAARDSVNFDDSGFFSVQVITKALELLGLSMVSWSSQHPEAISARQDPSLNAHAYICNHRQHWFTIRRFGPNYWFNLNSLLTQPEYVSPTHLSLFLTQLQSEGYSIFVVVGELPQSTAEEYFTANTFAAEILRVLFCNVKPSKTTSKKVPGSKEENDVIDVDDDDLDLRRAIELSRQIDDDDDPTLKQALELSRQQEEEEELRRALELSKQSAPGLARAEGGGSFEDDSLLKRALEMSRHQAILDMPSTSAGPRLPPPTTGASSSGKKTSNGDVPHDNGESKLTTSSSSNSSSGSQQDLDAATLRMKRLEFLNKKA